MSDKHARIRAIIDAITAFLADNSASVPAARLTLARVEATDLNPNAFADLPPAIPRHEAVLDTAIRNMNDPRLLLLRQALSRAKDELVWRQDDMNYYPPGSDWGDG